MRKTRIFGLALFAILALGALLAVTASAELTLLAQWLVNGTAIAGELAIKIEGGILFEDTKVPLAGPVAVLCSVIFQGDIKIDGEGVILRAFNLAGEPISATPLTELALICSNVNKCEAGTAIELWPENLSWPTLLFLAENGELLDLIEKIAFEATCLVLGLNMSDLCESTDSTFPVHNETTAEIPAAISATPMGTCTLSGMASGQIETDELIPISLVEMGTLTASSE